MTHRATRAFTGLCASVLAVAPLVVLGVATAPSADAAAPPGTPWTFGENSFGQLGNGTTTTRRTPGPVTGLNGVIDLHGGREHVVALKSNGTVWTWGSNVEGQQGRGTTANTLAPTQVTSLGTDNVAVETGHNHTMVLKSNGTVWEFGLNTDGQLGDGTTTLRRSPVQVAGITDAVAIAAGRDMSYAIRANGQLWGWGRNDEGQLGDGTTTRRLAPVRVGTSINFTGVKAITGGRDHAVAVKTDGSVWSWGENDYGQVGDGSTTDRLTPVAIDVNGATAGMGTASDAAAGAHHSFALRTDGTVASWGRNYRTELGDGTSTNRTRPVNVLMGTTGSTPLTGAVSIGSGRDMGNVTLADGRVMAWGHNLYGQLGDGTTTNRTRAIVVPGISNAVKASGGGSAYGVILVGDSTTPPPNQDPVAHITGTTCTDLSCPLSGSTSTDDQGISSYAWTFGDTTTGTGVSPGHTYAAGGTYTVTLTVTDGNGATDTDTVTVHSTDPVDPPPNQDPVAHITGTTCSGHVCPLSGSTSTDDHGITSYAWDFGDTTTGTGVSPGHTYATADTFTVTLTVTDANGATDTDTAQVTTTDTQSPAPSFRASAATDANTSSASVVVPATVAAGDQLVLVATNAGTATQTTPAGWTLIGTTTDGTEMRSSVYTRTAAAGLAGTTVRVALSALSKTSLSLLAYADAAPVTVLANAVQGTASVTVHPAPAVNVATAGSAVLRYWSDKSSSDRIWTTSGVTNRTLTNGTGGGSLSAITGDTTGEPAGTAPALNATASLASAKAITWSIVVPHS
ncbi:PKD domain-containing protein [Marmoricola sp. URHB0036]|uniref:RCC1 domain-containing protein n=1 Tax=Marmoricola sp. URHB0036 TaxID=1298863 RepID=UPI0004202D11|nr:PKD domain-containing protein [Marmoricola sp. URHB0036]